MSESGELCPPAPPPSEPPVGSGGVRGPTIRRGGLAEGVRGPRMGGDESRPGVRGPVVCVIHSTSLTMLLNEYVRSLVGTSSLKILVFSES